MDKRKETKRTYIIYKTQKTKKDQATSTTLKTAGELG
jgi:hypothetical protein